MTITVYTGSGHAQEGKAQVEQASLSAYRGRTMALLRRYFRMSLDIGRLPSVLGREFFRARVTSKASSRRQSP